jgi:hypothetical protein
MLRIGAREARRSDRHPVLRPAIVDRTILRTARIRDPVEARPWEGAERHPAMRLYSQ